jgi:HPt (histidine-containing phosphotransfer) domain-containing protein
MPSAEPAAAGQDALIERLRMLEGIDVAAALRNVGGQTDFLAHVLLDFIDVYQDGDQRLALTDSKDDAQRWSQACHSLLGAALTIGATQLARSSATLEQELKAGAPASMLAARARELDRMLIDFVQRLATELEATDARHAS